MDRDNNSPKMWTNGEVLYALGLGWGLGIATAIAIGLTLWAIGIAYDW